jgi:hypothetical protein
LIVLRQFVVPSTHNKPLAGYKNSAPTEPLLTSISLDTIGTKVAGAEKGWFEDL